MLRLSRSLRFLTAAGARSHRPGAIREHVQITGFFKHATLESPQLALQLLDARGHDVHELVDLRTGNAERRRESHDLAARVDDRAPVPRLAIEPGHQLLVEGPARAVGRHELGAHHEPAAAHLADDALLADHLLEPVEQARAHRRGVRHEVVLLHAGDGVRRVGAGVHVLLPGVGGEGVSEPAPRDGGRERNVAGRDALGDGHEVGDDAVVLAGEPAPGAAEPGDDLVGDHQHVELVAEGADRAEPADRRHDEAPGGDHRLHDDRRHGLRPLGDDRLAQLAGAALHQFLVGPPAPVAERVRRRDLGEARHVKIRVRRHQVGQPADGAGARRPAVVTALERDDLVLGRLARREPVVAGHLHGALVGLGAADREAVEKLLAALGPHPDALGPLDHELFGGEPRVVLLVRPEVRPRLHRYACRP